MESQIAKHLMPYFGDLPIASITERKVQEFIADLSRANFERRKRTGELIKSYQLSRKTILNILGLLKLIVGRKAWRDWDLDIKKAPKPKQRFFTESQLKRIIEAAPGQFKVLFALLAGTGMRIGEAAGLYVEDVDLEGQVIHVRRGIWKGRELAPKTENAVREIDIDGTLTEMLRDFIGNRTSGRLFQTRKGTPLAHGNIRNRILTPLLKELGVPRAGLHAFRHSRVNQLRRSGTHEDLQLSWIGHSTLQTTRGYSHLGEDLEFRKAAAARVGLDRVLRPNGPKEDDQHPIAKASVKATA